MSTAATCRSRDAERPCRGPRLSVRRRRLRSLRGEGRPPGRRAPPHGAAAALARRTAHRHADVAARRSSVVLHEVVRRNRVALTASSICRSRRGVARRDHAFPPRRHAPSVVVTARKLEPAAQREASPATASPSSRVPDNRWARVDIKSVGAAAQRAGQAGGARAGRPRGLVRRRGRLRHRRLVVATPGSSPRDGKVVTRQADHGILRGITRTVRARRDRRRRGSSSRSAPSRSRRPTRRARPSSPRRARSCCRWCGSTAARSATARRAWSRRALRREFHRYAETGS